MLRSWLREECDCTVVVCVSQRSYVNALKWEMWRPEYMSYSLFVLWKCSVKHVEQEGTSPTVPSSELGRCNRRMCSSDTTERWGNGAVLFLSCNLGEGMRDRKQCGRLMHEWCLWCQGYPRVYEEWAPQSCGFPCDASYRREKEAGLMQRCYYT